MRAIAGRCDEKVSAMTGPAWGQSSRFSDREMSAYRGGGVALRGRL
jgi:hypothetical protein